MQFLSRQTIKHLQDAIQKSYSLPIFKGYRAINKTGVEKLIDELYANLPEDVHRAREYLRAHDYEFKKTSDSQNLYGVLQKFESTLNEGFPIAQFLIVNIREIEDLLSQIENNIPQEIIKAEILNK